MRGAAWSLARGVAPGLLAAGLATGSVGAQTDPGAPAGAVQTVHVERAFDGYDVPVAPFGGDRPPVRRIEGVVDWTAYRLDDAEATVAGVMRAYRERLAALGFVPAFECAGKACGGFDFRFGAEILPPPGMRIDVRDFAQLTARRGAPEEFVSVLASRVLDAVYVQTVAVARSAAEMPAPVADVPDRETAPESALLAQDVQDVLAALTRDGHVTLGGLEFEPGGARLSDASAEALALVAQVLGRDEGLGVLVVGHSDNEGALEANVELSLRRAEAVVEALVARGVAPEQVEARGFGYLAPVASNATEEGRAANRRVELVLR